MEIHNHTAILEQFGLNRNDTKIYTALLALGRSKTGPIIKETNIASSRVYASLRHLVLKGLVSYQVKNNIKYYQAELPHQLIEEAEHNAAKLKKLSHELEQFPIMPQARNETNTYEGKRGFKMAYEQHIAGIEPKETISIITFVGPEYKNSPDLRAFFSDTVDRVMIKKKSRARMITNHTTRTVIETDRPDSSIYDIRYLSSRYMLPYTLNISRKEVMISVWGETPVVFSINNPIVIMAFQKHFDSMWKMAKEK